MLVQSPLKRSNVRPNLRRVNIPDKDDAPRTKKSGNTGTGKTTFSIPKLKPWKVILSVIVIGVMGFLYLTHVLATQKLLNEVQMLENNYNKARTEYDEFKLRYERMIGPAEIYRKAQTLGFINGGPAEQVIIIKD